MRATVGLVLAFAPFVAGAETTEFCLEGYYDLGARLQGTTPEAGEEYETTWCVTTEDDTDRVLFSAQGWSNPDMRDSWTVAYLPPDLVRIVNRDDPPDVEFAGADMAEEARRVRRLDPRRLLEEWKRDREALPDLTYLSTDTIQDVFTTTADLPLRGRVDIRWVWDIDTLEAATRLFVDELTLFRGIGRWRVLDEEEAAAVWEGTLGEDPIEAPGDRWPSAISTRLISLTDDVYLARGVRTGFQHIVIDTEDGLVIGDAPAGWVEFHQVPPADLVPGLGISGLSERFVDFLVEEFPDRPIHAVALTHAHDDHAGGARAFAAAGADVYAPEEVANFLESALNRDSMPEDRLTPRRVEVMPVGEDVSIGDSVRLVSIGSGPHANAMLGVWATDHDYFFVSDIHVPRDEASRPRDGRERTECWFADWAVAFLPPEVRVVNSHSPVITPVSRLEEYLDSDACRSLWN